MSQREIEYTYVPDTQLWSCDNCGAFAATPDQVSHFPGCKAGECKRWQEYYNTQENDEVQE